MSFYIRSVVCIALLALHAAAGFCANGIKLHDRIRIIPEISAAIRYSDNIFLSEENNKQSDTITSIAPNLTVDLAVAPRNFFSLSYKGNYQLYERFDNLGNDSHDTGLSWSYATRKHSEFSVGANVVDSSFQSYSEQDTRKDYALHKIYADVLNRPINQTLYRQEANSVGAALIAAVALGKITWDQIPELIPITKTFQPRSEYRALYDELFEVFVQIYKNNKKLCRKLNKFQKHE